MKQKGLLAAVERKQKLLSGALEDLRGKLFQDVVVLDDRISVEEAEPFDKREAIEEPKKRRKTKAEEWTATHAVESALTRKAVSETRGSKVEVGPTNELEVGVHWKGTWEDQGLWCGVEDSQKKK